MAVRTVANNSEKNRGAVPYEILVWLLYVCLFKYAHLLDSKLIDNHIKENFPYPQMCFYGIGITLYTIPYYRWIGPVLLSKKKYISLFFTTILFFFFFSKLCNWGISSLFLSLDKTPQLQNFYNGWNIFYRHVLSPSTGDLSNLLTDILAFISVMFVRYAFENERKKHELEKDNLSLQLETLKAQLQPHFLFNTLNNIYGMSITGSKDTPEFILRLSDMMRYILYDCRQSKVPLKKDIEFLQNYFAMEKKRYPNAEINFTVMNTANTDLTIAPLLFIPFIENSFKHGAHRLNDNGFIKGELVATNSALKFSLSNDVFTITTTKDIYGGVGIENIKKRLQLYYPKEHHLTIIPGKETYRVQLNIELKQ